MKRNRDLESRLTEWGREYGGGRYEEIGWQGLSPMAVIAKYHGKAPDGLNQKVSCVTGGDEVQAAVTALARQLQGFVPAKVLSAEYLCPGQPIEMKLQKLKRVGFSMSRVRYYQHLRLARVHIAGWLKLPFSECEDEADAA